MSEVDTQRRSGRGVKIALALSLALNLAVVGVVAGAYLGRDGGGGDHTPALRSLGLGPFAIALDRDHRADLRDRIEGTGVSLRDDRRAIGRALRDVQQALVAEPFDRAQADAALAQSRGLVVGLQETGHTALLDLVEDMTPAERVELAEQLNRVMRRGGARR
jgi:uncharacterized membrane protein